MLEKSMVNKNTIYQWRRVYVRENQSNVCPTLTANMGEGGHNVPLIITPYGFRKLTPRECLNFQGFPKEYCFPNIAQSKKYKQAGNSVTVPLIQRVAQQIIEVL
jgi:DNA (cytosine-5)-methyltransferase 1